MSASGVNVHPDSKLSSTGGSANAAPTAAPTSGSGAGAGAGSGTGAGSASATAAATASRRAAKIPKVLTWQNPVQSGTLLAEILGVLLIIRYGNLLRTGLRALYWAIGLTGAAEFVTRHALGRGAVSSNRPSRYIRLNEAALEKYTSRLIRTLNGALTEVKSLLDAECLADSAIAFVAVVFLYILTAFVSVSAIFIFVTIAAFSLPKLYLTFQKEADEIINAIQEHLHHHAKNVQSQVHAVAGPHLETARKHIGGVADRFGYNRGVPETPKSAATSTAPPGGAAVTHDKIPEAVKAKKVAADSGNTSSVDPSSGSSAEPSLASSAASNTPAPTAPTGTTGTTGSAPAAPSVAARTIDGVTYDSVPTMLGNVDLKEKATDAAAKATTAADAQTADHASGLNIASELKNSINSDKAN